MVKAVEPSLAKNLYCPYWCTHACWSCKRRLFHSWLSNPRWSRLYCELAI